MEKCAICHKRLAVVYMTKLEQDGQSVTQGICLKCARDLGIKPVEDMINKLGITPGDIDFDTLDENIEEYANTIMGDDNLPDTVPENSEIDDKEKETEETHESNEGRAPSIDFNKLFGSGMPFMKMQNRNLKN